MAGDDRGVLFGFGDGLELAVAPVAGAGFAGVARWVGPGDAVAGQAPAFGEGCNMVGVGSRIGAPLVVTMADRQSPAPFRLQVAQQLAQGEGVLAPGDGDEDAVSGAEEGFGAQLAMEGGMAIGPGGHGGLTKG